MASCTSIHSDMLVIRHKARGLASYAATSFATIVLATMCHAVAADSADVGVPHSPVESDNAYEWLAYNIPVYHVESVSIAEALDAALGALKRVAGAMGKPGPIGLWVYDPPMGAVSPRITAKLEDVSFGRYPLFCAPDPVANAGQCSHGAIEEDPVGHGNC